MAKARKPKSVMLKAWLDGMASPAAAANYKDGINRVTESPMAKAVEKADDAARSYTRVVTSEEHKAMMRAYPLSKWKGQATSMAGRLADGAKKASPKYDAFLEKFGGVWDAMLEASMANAGTGIAAAKAKSAAALEVLMMAGKKYGGQGV